MHMFKKKPESHDPRSKELNIHSKNLSMVLIAMECHSLGTLKRTKWTLVLKRTAKDTTTTNPYNYY